MATGGDSKLKTAGLAGGWLAILYLVLKVLQVVYDYFAGGG